MKSLFECRDYKQFIRSELDLPRFGRGARTKLAAHLGVQASFISLVLSGAQEFSPEHGLRIAQFLGLSPSEGEYLLLLIQRDRAGSAELKRHFQGLIDRTVAARNEIRSRVKSTDRKVSAADLMEYYGAWFHIAVHMCVRNPKMKDVDTIAQTLGVDRAEIKKSLLLLERIGFIRTQAGKYEVKEHRFHLGDHPTIQRTHHMNWRQIAIRSMDERAEGDLHYSLVMSIDRDACAAIKQIMLESIERVDPLLKVAADREVVALNIDLFRVSRT